MNEAKFTKGPWSTRIYASCSNQIVHGEFCEPVAFNVFKSSDAHLIAAAPEMYTMLEDLRERIGSLDEDALGFVADTPDQQGWFIREEILYKIDQLLSKARGEK